MTDSNRENSQRSLTSNLRLALMTKLRSGGDYLAVARSFLQRRAIGGDRITWGTNAEITGLTARDIEDMALEIAAAAIMQDRVEQPRKGHETGVAQPFPYPTDRDGWICSVCHGWNVPKDRVCMHSHLPSALKASVPEGQWSDGGKSWE